MKKTVLALLLLSTIYSCQKPVKSIEHTAESKITNALWFLGKWGNSTVDGSFTETWQKINDSTFTANSFMIIDKDTVFSETVSLEDRLDTLRYIVTVPNQNQEKPVAFILTKATENELLFENPEHDFPQKISYKLIGNDSLVAEVSAIVKGKEKKEIFRMKKINN